MAGWGENDTPVEVGGWDAGDKPVEPNVAEDVVKSTGVGLGKGLIGLAGMPGDIAEYGARGIDWATQKVGNLTGIDVGKPREARAPTYGSEDIQKGVEENFTGPFRKPQTEAGKYAERVGEFLPAVIGGPETLAARVLRRAVLPGVASEGVEQATGSPLAGAITGAVTGMRFSGTKYAVPTIEDLEKEGNRLFKSKEISGVRIQAPVVEKELGSIMDDLEKTIDPDLMKGTFSRLSKERELHAPVPPPQTLTPTQHIMGWKPSAKPDVTIDDVSTLRKQLSKIAGDYSPSRTGEDRMAATIAIGKVDDFLAGLSQSSLTAGDASKAIPILQEARDTWAAMKRMETVDKKIASAALRAGSTYSGQNLENAIRQNLRRIIDPDSPAGAKLRRGWNELELARAKDIVDGAPLSNSIRFIGNKMSGPHGIAGGAVIGLEGLYHGNLKQAAAGFGLPVAGYGLKELGNVRTYRRAQELKDVLGSRSPLAERWKREGRMKPVPPLATTLGAATYVGGPGGFKKGGRVTKTFRYRAGGGPAGPGGDETQQVSMVNDPAADAANFPVNSPDTGLQYSGGSMIPTGGGGPGGGGYNYSDWAGATSPAAGDPLGGWFSTGRLQDAQRDLAMATTVQPGMRGPGGQGDTPRATITQAGQDFLNAKIPSFGPGTAQGRDQPSTFNWRLLPPPYNTPNYMMQNGHIIDRRAAAKNVPAYGAYEADLADPSNIGVVWGPGAPGAGYPASRGSPYVRAYYYPGQIEPPYVEGGGNFYQRGGRIKKRADGGASGNDVSIGLTGGADASLIDQANVGATMSAGEFANRLAILQGGGGDTGIPETGWFKGDPTMRVGTDAPAGAPNDPNSGGWSTNNWRLLPQGYNDPRYIMRNSTIMERAGAADPYTYFMQRTGRGGGGMGAENLGTFSMGSGRSMGFPLAFAASPRGPSYGFFPGQLGAWANLEGATTARGGRIKGKKGLPSIRR